MKHKLNEGLDSLQMADSLGIAAAEALDVEAAVDPSVDQADQEGPFLALAAHKSQYAARATKFDEQQFAHSCASSH